MNNRRSLFLTVLARIGIYVFISGWNVAISQTPVPKEVLRRVEESNWQPWISFPQMNLLYAGIDNTILVFTGDNTGKVSISIKEGTVIPNVGKTSYKVKPMQIGPSVLVMTVGGRTFRFPVSVKRLPNPELMAGRLRAGKCTAATLKMQGGLTALLTDAQFDFHFDVIGYTVGANGGTFGAYREAVNDGANWNGEAALIINKAGPGTSVFFHNIMVKGPDGVKRNLGTIAFQLGAP